MTLNALYDIAEKNNICVYHFDLSPIESMSVPGYIGIDADLIQNTTDEKEKLAHELGHCIRGAFYTGSSPYELRTQKEYRATKWEIQTLIPFREFYTALDAGITTPWELAEYFEVPEKLIHSALKLYEAKIINAKYTIQQ